MSLVNFTRPLSDRDNTDLRDINNRLFRELKTACGTYNIPEIDRLITVRNSSEIITRLQPHLKIFTSLFYFLEKLIRLVYYNRIRNYIVGITRFGMTLIRYDELVSNDDNIIRVLRDKQQEIRTDVNTQGITNEQFSNKLASELASQSYEPYEIEEPERLAEQARQAREEAVRQTREAAERQAREEAERQAREEPTLLVAERRREAAREAARRRAREAAERQALEALEADRRRLRALPITEAQRQSLEAAEREEQERARLRAATERRAEEFFRNMNAQQVQEASARIGKNTAFIAKLKPSLQLLEESIVIHPNYENIQKLKRPAIVKGYVEGCNLLHGYNTGSYNLYQNLNNTPTSRGVIKVSARIEPEESYIGIVGFLKINENKSKEMFVRPQGPGINLGGISREFSNAVGNYIKENFMIPVVPKDCSRKSQAGGAAAAAPNHNNNPTTGNSNASNSEKKSDIDLSPMDFNLSESTTEEKIEQLAPVLGYYAFVVPKINDQALNLGINFSAFALIVLFNDDIISKLITILTKLKGFYTTTNAEGNKRVHEYFQLEFDPEDIPVYNPESTTRAEKKFRDLDIEIEYLIGLFYAIDELYYPDDFTRNLNTQIESKKYIPPFEELISLVSKYTHSSRDRFQSQANSENDRIYDDEITSLLLKLEKLGLIGALFRQVYNDTYGVEKYNFIADARGDPIDNIFDLFSLGQCISQNENITAESIKSIITYQNDPTPENENSDNVKIAKQKNLDIVKTAINRFLEINTENKQMLYKFLKYITGSLSLPSQITINVINNPNIRIIAHTCFKSLDVGTNPDVSTPELLTSFLEAQILSDTGFSTAGGSRKTHTHSRKQYRKQSHKKSHKHNKNKIGKRTRNNKKTGKKRI